MTGVHQNTLFYCLVTKSGPGRRETRAINQPFRCRGLLNNHAITQAVLRQPTPLSDT